MCANEPQEPCRQGGAIPEGRPLKGTRTACKTGEVDATERLQAAFRHAAIEGERRTSSTSTIIISTTTSTTMATMATMTAMTATMTTMMTATTMTVAVNALEKAAPRLRRGQTLN